MSAPAAMEPLLRLGLELEMAAGRLNACAALGDAEAFPACVESFDFARQSFRDHLEGVTDAPAAWIERILAL